MMKPSELLSKPSAWCQGSFALSADGECTGVRDANACKWCMEGAMMHCLVPIETRTSVSQSLGGGQGGGTLIWNDAPERTQEEVVAKLKELGL